MLERVIEDEECPLMLQTGTTQLILKKKHEESQSSPPEVSPTHHHSPLSTISTTGGHTPSALSVQRNWLSMHHDLIVALSQFTSALQHQPTDIVDDDRQQRREKILEQSLIQQSQIVEMLQKMVGSLETENELIREKNSNLEHRVRGMKMWKTRARLAEDRLREMAESTGTLGSSQSGIISFSALASFEKTIAEKDELIASLQSRLGGEDKELERNGSVPTRTKLAAERVRVLELEEQLFSCREDSSKALGELSDYQSGVMRRESEIQYLKHAIEAGRKMSLQQQDVVMGLRTALQDRDAQIASLTQALQRTAVDDYKKRPSRNPSEFTPQNIFDLLLGREVFNVQLTRPSRDSELGFSVSRFEMPISSRMSSLIVRAVKEGSSAQGLLLPGDEILEVNGLNCRSTISQKKAIQTLEKATGLLKIVAAREQGPAEYFGRIRSTPIISETSSSQSTLWETANDASFAPISPSHLSHNVSSPQHYHISLPNSPGSPSTHDVPMASHIRPQPIGQLQVKVLEQSSPDKQRVNIDDEDSMRTKETELEREVYQLRAEAGHHQTVQNELEEELDAVHSELEALKMEQQLTMAENYDLQQQVKSKISEIVEIQEQVEELQQLLLGVREKVEREEERTRVLEEQNNTLQKALTDAMIAGDIDRQKAAEVKEELVQLKLDFESEKSELLSQMATVQSHNKQLQSDVKSISVQLELAKTSVSEYESKCVREKAEAVVEIQQLKTDLQQLREQSAKEVSSLQIEAEKLQTQLTTSKTLLMAAEKKETELKIELRQLRQAADESNKQLIEHNTTYCTLRGEVAVIREQAESKTLECESLTMGLKRAEGKMQANKDMSSRQRYEIDNLRQNNKRLLIERVKADEERSKAEVTLRICRSEQAQAREKLQSQSGERDGLFSELEALVAENSTLQQQLDCAQEKLVKSNAENEQIEKLQCELDREREARQELRIERDALQNELSLELSKMNELKKALTTAEAAVMTVEVAKKKSDDLVSSMMFVHEQDQATVSELEETLANVQSGLEEIRVEAVSVQEGMNLELQQLGSECAGLREKIKGLETLLDEERSTRASEVETLKKTISSSEQNINQLQVELESRESANNINQAAIAQLQSTSQQVEQERERSQQTLKDALEQSHLLQLEIDRLQTHTTHLETNNADIVSENKSLQESCADLESVVKQRNGQIYSLTARLEVTKMNLTETQQRMNETMVSSREMKNNLTELEKKYHESEINLQKAESKVHEVTLSLHMQEEEILQLKTKLEMSMSEHDQLLSTIIVLQTTTTSQDKKITSLETERDNMRIVIDQLTTTQSRLKKVITSLEKEKTHTDKQTLQETEFITQQLKDKTSSEIEHLSKIQQLERLYSEAQSTVDGLLAAQDALRSSLTTLGDENENEIMRLRDKLISIESELVQSQQQVSQAKSREEALQRELSVVTDAVQSASDREIELLEEMEQMKEEREQFIKTDAQLTDLHQKMDSLERSQKERNSKMVAMQDDLETQSRELETVKAENILLMERVGEMAAMNVTLAEKTAEVDRLKGELAAEVKGRQEAVNEKEQLLKVLQRSEVERHTASVTTPTNDSSLHEADREQLIKADKEEEAVRLREYVGKLLSAVVDKAPFVLEKM